MNKKDKSKGTSKSRIKVGGEEEERRRRRRINIIFEMKQKRQ